MLCFLVIKMKKNKILTFFLIAILGISTFVITAQNTTLADPTMVDPLLLDVNERERIENAPISTSFSDTMQTDFDSQNATTPATGSGSPNVIGDQKLFLALNDYYGYYFFALFILYAQSENGEVWVQNNRNWPASNPRDNNEQMVTIEQAEYLLNEFETNIYAQEAAFYGTPGFQNGSNSILSNIYCQPGVLSTNGFPDSYCDWSDSNGRTAILVENVRDDNYYIPGYPVYIAGFYSSTLDAYFDRNIMTIDSYDWINRVGPNGNRPYLYESTFAHEYQHLIHADYVPGDDSFINEGFSMYAEYLCGYGVDYGYVNAYFAQPYNSLTEWGDLGDINILGDYGEALLFTHYIENHYTGYQTTYMKNGIPGVAGIEQAVADTMGHKAHSQHQVTFDQLFNYFHIANLIQAKSGPFSYSSVDFSKANPLSMESLFNNSASGTMDTYGTYYYLLDGLNGNYILSFKGDTYSDVVPDPGWTLGTDGIWFSGGGDLIDRSIVGSAFVDASNPVLSFYTNYDIEQGWDFGIVQVSTDSGATWTSLSNEFTTSNNEGTTSEILAQLPGLTGSYAGIMTFDLSAYVGQNIMLRFRYMTDWSTNWNGWYIDSNSVTISGAQVSLAQLLPPPPPTVDWDVTIVAGIHSEKGDNFLNVDRMWINSVNQKGFSFLNFFNLKHVSNFYVVVITPRMDAGSASFELNLDQYRIHGHWF